ncbi:MAG: hypothetical protein IPM21_17540 [Acidobacteria bacterium]|nr:hypothetical protein [Acidobacteriota bacterium]
MKRLAPAFALFVFLGLTSFAQKAPPPPPPKPAPPPPIAKPTPAETLEKTDEEFAAEIIRSAEEPIEWKLREFEGFSVKALMPREPIRQTETGFQVGLGRMTSIIYLSVGENAVYVLGKTSLPYRVTDPKLLRDYYREFANGMSGEGPSPFQHIRDLEIAGNLAVELRSLPNDVRFQSTLSRAFIVGRDVFIMIAMPVEDEEDDEPPSEELIKARTAEFERFFNSIVISEQGSPAPTPDPPIFVATFESQLFRSNFFRFKLSVPEGWIRITQEDVADIQNWGRSTIRDETGGRTLPAPQRRTNLAAFLSGPIGMDGLGMINITVANEASSFAEVKRLSGVTATLLSGISSYKVVEPPTQVNLGNISAMRMKNRITLAGASQDQYFFFLLRRGRVLGITVTCTVAADCTTALEAVSKIEFEK